ncbi:hypothetical protein GCM10009859_06410 [Kocuria salsicia]
MADLQWLRARKAVPTFQSSKAAGRVPPVTVRSRTAPGTNPQPCPAPARAASAGTP